MLILINEIEPRAKIIFLSAPQGKTLEHMRYCNNDFQTCKYELPRIWMQHWIKSLEHLKSD